MRRRERVESGGMGSGLGDGEDELLDLSELLLGGEIFCRMTG